MKDIKIFGNSFTKGASVYDRDLNKEIPLYESILEFKANNDRMSSSHYSKMIQ